MGGIPDSATGDDSFASTGGDRSEQRPRSQGPALGVRQPLRVLHCPTTCGGNPQHLARAERAVGLQSWAVAFGENAFQYEADEVIESRLLIELKRWNVLWRAMRRYDVIHFNMGRTIFPPLVTSKGSSSQQFPSLLHDAYGVYARALGMKDLALLHRMEKGIFVTFQGGDARQGIFSTPRSDIVKRKVIAAFDRYADGIFYLNPDLAQFLPPRARFLPYAHIDLQEWRPPASSRETGKPVLLHAPSDRAQKGTQYVLDAVETLRREGIDFEFSLVEGVPRQEARPLYERADILVEQFVAGWYGALAVEMMALGKPVVGHIDEHDLRVVPEGMRADLPIIRATGDSLADTLRQYLALPVKALAELGARCRAYVESWHDPIRIARQLRREYETAMEGKRASRA
jgi:glycosyltransferase involved in cell wall biosynthesis